MSNFLDWLFGTSSNKTSSQPAASRPTAPAPAPAPTSAPALAPQGGLPAWLKQDPLSSGDSRRNSITVYDLKGNPLQLDFHHEKASGGEGTVYTLPGNDKVLIKVYKEQTINDPVKLAELRQRITAMSSVSACRSMDFLAWPIMPVYNAQKQIIGFAMRRCEGKSFLALRGADNPARNFPGWDRK